MIKTLLGTTSLRIVLQVALATGACSTPDGVPQPSVPTHPEDWTTIARGRGLALTVAVERALYLRSGSPHFFVRVRLINNGPSGVGVDLRKYHEVFYPNQWGASAVDHREAIDERRMILPPFDAAAAAAVTRDLQAGVLTMVPAGGSFDYYEEFNASGRAAVDAQARSLPWVVVALDGQLRVADPSGAERLIPTETAPSGPGSLTRDVAVHAPVAWRIIPPGALVIVD